jgi:uncharacterized protein
MIVYHVAVSTAEDYLTRREAHRRAHIERLQALRSGGVFVGGGPAPDGKTADVFYRVPQAPDLDTVIREDPYWVSGSWTRYEPRSFAGFVEPWELPPVVLDGSRRVTIVEGPTTDHDMAQFALIEMRGAGRLAFGGFFADGQSLAVARTPDADAAVGWFRETGFWNAEALTGRPLLYAL